MATVSLLLTLYLCGLAIAAAWGPRRHPVVCVHLAFPLGLAAAASLVLLSLLLNLQMRPVVIVGLAAVVFVAGWVARLRLRWQRADWTVVAGFTGLFVVLAYWYSAHLIGSVSYMAVKGLMLGRAIAGPLTTFDTALWHRIGDVGPMTVCMGALAQLVHRDYLPAMGALCALSAIGLTAGFVACAARRGGTSWWWSSTVGVVAAVAVAAMPEWAVGTLSIGSGPLAVVYLLGFVYTWCLAEDYRDASMIPAALLCLFCMGVIAAPAAGLGLALLAAAVWLSRLPGCSLQWPVAGAVAAWVAVWAVGGQNFSADSRGAMTGEASRLLTALTLGFIVVWLWRRSPRSFGLARAGLVLALAIGGALAVVGGKDLTADIVRGWSSLEPGRWPLLATGALVACWWLRIVRRDLLFISILGSLVVALAVAGHGPSGPLTTEQATAMFLPLAIAAVALGASRLFANAQPIPLSLPNLPARPAAYAAGLVAALAGLIIANLHQLGFSEARQTISKQIRRDRSTSLLVRSMAVRSTRVRARHPAYHFVADRVRAERVVLAPDMSTHVPYFAQVSGARVELAKTSLLLPRSAVAQVIARAAEHFPFGVPGGAVVPIYFVVDGATTDYVVVWADDYGAMFWMPSALYVELGGRL
jgi:hypothetical protein